MALLGMVTVGRVLFALIARWFPPNRTYHALPFLLAVMFVVIAVLPSRTRRPTPRRPSPGYHDRGDAAGGFWSRRYMRVT
jgi:hypothetical protein